MALVSLLLGSEEPLTGFVTLTAWAVCATERTLCCLLENFQTEEGFKVPKVLQKYIPGQPDFLPFGTYDPTQAQSQPSWLLLPAPSHPVGHLLT